MIWHFFSREREREIGIFKNYRTIAKFSFFTKIIHLNKNHTLQLSIKFSMFDYEKEPSIKNYPNQRLKSIV